MSQGREEERRRMEEEKRRIEDEKRKLEEEEEEKRKVGEGEANLRIGGEERRRVEEERPLYESIYSLAGSPGGICPHPPVSKSNLDQLHPLQLQVAITLDSESKIDPLRSCLV